ncbi:hypothetical protein ACIGXM_31870 [Kitasatospora sp. NPDC052896]|uniref:hypothetical protein n=1 Tax=Kitasatospora sp. NPDC052896 TaxID=3364061 RepID=UPI0037CAD3FC
MKVAEGLRSDKATFLPNKDGSFKVEVDMGRPIGPKGERWIRILANDEGKACNAFPCNP